MKLSEETYKYYVDTISYDMQSELIIFQGHKYRRYPESKHRTDRMYFQQAGGKGFLHRHIWEYYNGHIPDGYHVHHIDENPLNNELSNLALVPMHTHLSDHALKLLKDDVKRSEYIDRLHRIQPLTKEWHKSDAGREWHRSHATKTIQNRPVLKVECVNCHDMFETQGNGRDRFCSNKCKSAYRRMMKLDNVDRICKICGDVFSVNRYEKTLTCSKKCSTALASKKTRGVIAI